MRRISSLVVAGLLFAKPAAAEDPPRTTTRWYGWQTLAVDAAGIGVSLAVRSEAPYMLATLAGAPAVHFAHGHQVRALVDFGVRVVLPAAVGLAVAGPYDPPEGESDKKYERFVIGATIGAVLASAFDAVVLGRETVEIPRETAGIRVAPTGISGRF